MRFFWLTPQKLGISTEKGRGRITRQGKRTKIAALTALTAGNRSTVSLTGRPVCRGENLKRFPRISFSPISSGASGLLPFQLPWRDFLRPYSLLRCTFSLWSLGFLDFGTQAYAFGRFPPQLARQSLRQCIPALEAFQVCVHPSPQPRLLHLSLSDGT